MKKIIRTTERNWQCPYCGFLNDLSENTCEKCGAIRNGDEVEKEITTNFEETTTTETGEVPDVVISTHKNVQALLAIIVGLIAVFAAVFIIHAIVTPDSNNGGSSKNAEQYTVLSKEWEYTISIGEMVEETRITSYTEPPKGATNIETRQVQQSNGWYKTEYTYDYADWKTVRTETITGSGEVPNFKEYTLAEGEKLMNTPKVRYTVTVMTASGKKTISVSESKWISIVIGNTYSSSEF